MPMNTQWTRAQLRAKVRQELMDPSGKWWGDTELNGYIGDWQNTLQDEFELVWATSTATTSGPTISLGTAAADMLRLDAVYWNGERLTPTSVVELDEKYPTWKELTALDPIACLQTEQSAVTLFPAPTVAGTVVFEYPKKLAFAGDSTAMSLPAWMRYSAVNFACAHAYGRLGPNQDVQKSKKYDVLFEEQKRFYKLMKDRFFPQKIHSLRPGGSYAGRIVNPINPPTLLSL